ncbi:MAG: ComEC/Rec2 family competence protein [Chloroflexi bacterium]|nr:ComEC/Rec2 family competence protein [Chloroflexota bacterium]
MTRLLTVPLAASAAVAVALAFLGAEHPMAAVIAALTICAAGALLAIASADVPRRTMWAACAASAAAIAARAVLPVPPIDPWPLLAVVAGVREPLATALHGLVPEPESGILLGIVLGERSSIGRDLRDAFAITGTAHLLAISGFNMTLVATAVAFGLRGRTRPAAVAVATLAAVVAYSVLVGPAAGVTRAALMAVTGALALALGRRTLAANALSAAVVAMLVADPFALEDVGFILSVTATAGLIAWQRPLSERLGRLPGPLAEALAATIAASIPTMPVVAAVFGRISIVSPIANLVAVPLFAPIMLFGAATALIGALAPAAAGPLALVSYVAAAALRRAVEAFAGIPFAAVEVPSGPPAGAAVAVLLLGAWLAAPRLLERLGRAAPRLAPRPIALAGVRSRALVAAGVVALVGGALVSFALPRAAGSRVHALDVGQGDAFLLESDGRYALIDGGPDATVLLRRLGEILPPWHRRIDLVALTHEHADHGTGLLAVLDRYEVGLAIEPAGMADVPLTRMWWERLARSNVPRRAVRAGTVIRVGGAAVRVLAPGDRRVEVPSLVLRVSAGSGSALFMGDAVDEAIADLLLAPDALAARVYVPPHHGADTSHAGALAAAVRPAAAVISSGALNRYGHPTPGTLAALDAVAVYRTDRYGTVVLTLDADPLVVRTAKAGVPPHRGGPVPRASAPR